MPRILVVVLDFNGTSDTLACLGSLDGQDDPAFDVLVVDNGSARDDTARIRARFPVVEVIRSPANLGWAGGNNLGLRVALERGYGFVCLLNNDTLLDPRALSELRAAANLLSVPCLLHPRIYYAATPGIAQLDPALPEAADAAARALSTEHGLVEMDYAYGACLLMPVAVPARIGLLDERFFLQLEEEDFFRRARKASIRAYCAREARMLHKESASFGGRYTPDKIYYQVRNRLLLIEKHWTGAAVAARELRALAWSLAAWFRAIDPRIDGWGPLLRALLARQPHAVAVRQGIADYLRRRFGPRRGLVRDGGSNR